MLLLNFGSVVLRCIVMTKYANKVINDLNSIIDELPRCDDFDSLIYHPDTSFSRRSKFGLSNTVRFILGSGPSTLRNEIRTFFPSTDFSITPSALVQSRAKINSDLFKKIFYDFNLKYLCNKTFKDFRIIAVDGSKLNIPYNYSDSFSLHKGRKKGNGSAGKGYNQLHLSTAYDVLEHRYIDSVIKDITQYDEREAMLEMIHHYDGQKAIFIADRGYEGANLIENLNQKTNFVIRAKDLNSKNGLTTGLNLPDKEFDLDVQITFTNWNRKEYQSQKNKYKIIQKYQSFDFLNENTHFYEVNWRIVRFRLENTYEVLITNLDRDNFSMDDIKHLYNLRWGIEVGYRYLKHDLNLTHFISRKKEFIHQEIWAKLTMYNLCSIINEYLEDRRKVKKKKKHEHRINFSNAIHLIMDGFKKSKRPDGIPPDLDKQIIKVTSPIREDRKFARLPHPHSYIASNYRAY